MATTATASSSALRRLAWGIILVLIAIAIQFVWYNPLHWPDDETDEAKNDIGEERRKMAVEDGKENDALHSGTGESPRSVLAERDLVKKGLVDPALVDLRDRCGDKLLVVNVHVPKSGGSTVSEALQRCAEEQRRRFAYGHLASFLHMPPREQGEVRAVDAHMGYGMHLRPEFPRDRENCTVYTTLVRRLPKMIWSKFRFHVKGQNVTTRAELSSFRDKYLSSIDSAQSKLFLSPWSFRGSVSYQLCCYHDYQHPSADLYDEHGKYIDHPGEREFIEDYVFQNFTDVDPTCPLSFEERMECALRRLCNDFSIVGHIDDPRSVGNFFRQLGALLNCHDVVRDYIPSPDDDDDGKEGGVRRINPTSWPPFDPYAARLIRKILSEPGAVEDLSVMEFGVKLAEKEPGICDSYRSSSERPSSS